MLKQQCKYEKSAPCCCGEWVRVLMNEELLSFAFQVRLCLHQY